MNKRIVFVLTAGLSAGLAACTPPPPGPEARAEMQRRFVECFRKELSPTEAQISTLEGKVFAGTAEVEKVGEALRAASAKLEAGLEDPSVKEPELLERFRNVSELRGRLSEDHFRRMLLLRSVLSPEQVSRFLSCKRKLGPPGLPQD